MADTPLGRLYDQLTPAERFPLILAAVQRRDEAERRRLASTAARRSYSLPDYWGLLDAFDHLSTLHLLYVLDLAADFATRLWEEDRVRRGRGDTPADGGIGGLLYTGYLIRVHAEGWARLCAGYAVDPDALIRHLPGYPTARAAVRTAATASLADEAAAAYARQGEDGGAGHPTAEDVAEDYRLLLKKLADWWE
jgi:hypothetical protein